MVASLLDELGGGLIDVIRVHHASVQSVEFATDGEDAVFEAGLVFADNIGGDIEIKLVADEGEAETVRLTLATNDTADARELGGEELVVVDEGIVAVEEIPLLAFLCGEFLEEGADFGDDGDEIIELGGRNLVEFEAGGPFGSDKETVGPAERLPNSFGDEGSEGVEHLQNHFKSDLEKREIFIDFLAFEEPVGVFIPNRGIESFDGFREAIMLEIVLNGFFAGGEFAADPIFAEVVGGIGGLLPSGDLTFVHDGGGHFLVQDFDGNR